MVGEGGMNKRVDAVKVGEGPRVNGKVRIFILVTILLALGLSIYREALWELIVSVLQREGASHGIFVPIISAYLVWLRLEAIRRTPSEFALLPGAVLVGVGLAMRFIAYPGTGLLLPGVSFIWIACGLVKGLYGKALYKELRFPLLFLIAMIPLPEALYAALTEWMRMATTWGSVALLQVFHFPIHRAGYQITIPTLDLFISEGCSGIRYLIPYFVFGLPYAVVCKKTFISRTLAVLATIPIAIMAGVLRQTLIFLSATYISPVMAEHRPHVMISWFVFVTVLWGVISADRWGSGRGKTSDQ